MSGGTTVSRLTDGTLTRLNWQSQGFADSRDARETIEPYLGVAMSEGRPIGQSRGRRIPVPLINVIRSTDPLRFSLLARIGMAIGLFLAAYGKFFVEGMETQLLRVDVGFPSSLVPVLGSTELLLGASLLAGLGTRVVAALLLLTIIVLHAPAASSVLASEGFGRAVFETRDSLAQILICSYLIGFGAGSLSLDKYLYARMNPKHHAPDLTGA